MSAIDAIAVLSGCFQAGGYLYYLMLARRGDIEPNPASWLMFAYGTGLIVVIEADIGAGWRELLLPAVCALSSIVVAAIAWRNRKAVMALSMSDLWTFWADLALTVGYVSVWLLERAGHIGAGQRSAASILILGCALATTLTSFMPILRSTIRNRSSEHVGPWLVWSAAYALLLVATAFHPDAYVSAALLLYPAMNLVLHGTMVYLSYPKAGPRHV